MDTGNNTKDYEASFFINKRFCTMKIDTGAQANVMTRQTYDYLRKHEDLEQACVKLTTYSGENLSVAGRATFRVKHKRKHYDVDFVIVEDSDYPRNQYPLLGLKSSEEMGFIRRVHACDATEGSQQRKEDAMKIW